MGKTMTFDLCFSPAKLFDTMLKLMKNGYLHSCLLCLNPWTIIILKEDTILAGIGIWHFVDMQWRCLTAGQLVYLRPFMATEHGSTT